VPAPPGVSLQEQLANLVSEITPRLVSEIEILPWRRTQVRALHVPSEPFPVSLLSREGAARGVYVRVGSTNRRADAELVGAAALRARRRLLPGLDSGALDCRVVSESFAAIRKLAHRDLETLRLLPSHQGKNVSTVGGIILFGRDREHHFPDASALATPPCSILAARLSLPEATL
jgi:ATP-dependent DNA helicase RecG